MALLRSSVRVFALIFLAAFVLPAANLVAQANPVPLVNQPLVPNSVVPGSPGLTLTVNGTGFVSTSVVNWNGAALATTFVTSSKLFANVPASDVAVATTASVTVFSPAPGGGTSNAVPFTVTVPTSGLAFSASTIGVGLNPATVLVADFNHDGISDLAVVNQNQPDPECYSVVGSGTISILLGRGDGTFLNKSTLCVPDSEFVVATPPMVVGDFNNDGNTDLLVTYYTSPGVGGEIFLGNGDGTFTQGQLVGPPCCPIRLFLSIALDTNGDGNLDLAIPYQDDFGFNNIGILLGNGDGTFTDSSRLVDCTASNCFSSNAVVAGDFNGDGILDLASVFLVGTGGSQPVSIFLGKGDGTFTPATQQPSVTLVNPAFLTTGDFDGDGILDLVIADAGSTALTVLHGNGDGTFTQVSGEPPLPQFPSFVTTADLNGDGKLDLVFSSTGNTISIFLGNGDGTFHAGFVKGVDFAPYGVAVGDFNGDGRLDLAVTNGSDNTVSILLQTPVRPGVSVTLSSDQNPAYVYDPVTYSAVVTASRTTPTGSVTFKQGTTILGTAPLADGQATLTTTFANARTYPIVASYSGDENYRPKNSQTVKQIVTKYVTYIDAGSGPNPAVYGQAVTVGCHVYGPGQFHQHEPTGTVTFKTGSLSLGRVPLVNGDAFLTKTNFPAGTISITITYNGDAFNQRTSDIVNQSVTQASSTTTITSSLDPSVVGQNVKFKATVTSPTVVPVGTVTFTAGTTILGTVSLAGGKASLATSALPAGKTTVTATYNGTSNISGSSGAVVQTVKCATKNAAGRQSSQPRS
jgi:hypothetical protein